MKTTSEPVATRVSDPEIIVSDDLRPYYDAALQAAEAAGTRPEDDPFWKMTVERHALWVVAQRHGGIIPGRVRRPQRPIFEGVPSISDEEWAEWVKAYNLDQQAEAEYGEQLRADAAELAERILRDPFRSLRLHIHFQALHKAEESRRADQNRQQRRTHSIQVGTCPVCKQCAPADNGPVRVRALLDVTAPASPSLRSCLACWAIARELHVRNLANVQVGPHGRTRGDVVAEHLATHPPAA